jgi:hypothetical protein
MRLAAKSPQHVDRVAVALRQGLAIADPHHLRAARFILAFLAREVAQISGLRGIGDVEDRRAVRLRLAGLRIDRDRNIIAAAVVADIGDPAVALMMDGGLIGAARLQVVASDQLHVAGFRRRADHLLLCTRDACEEIDGETGCEFESTAHVPPPLFKANLRWLTMTISQRPAAPNTRP